MRILFSSLREASHFIPLVPFIKASLAQGHEVAVAAPDGLGERVAASGAQFFPVAHLGDEGLMPLWKQMHGMSDADASDFVIGNIFAGLCAEWAMPSLLTMIASFKPDILVHEGLEYATLIAAEKTSVRSVRVGIIGRQAEEGTLPLTLAALDGHRDAHGLPRDPTGQRVKDEARLTLFPSAIDSSTIMHGEVFRFRTALKQPAPPLPNYWPSQTGPFVYVTLGTVAGRFERARQMYRTAIAAVADLPARVLLTIGEQNKPEDFGELPANVHIEQFVPQDQLLPHATAVVCHGGSGSVIGALAAGLPQVVCPMFADQPYNAQSVADAGAGLALPATSVSVESLRAAVMRVIEDKSLRDNAQRIAADMATFPLVDEAPAVLARLAGRS